MLVAVLLFVRGTMALAAGDDLAVQRLIGSRTATEDVAEEVENLQARATGRGDVTP